MILLLLGLIVLAGLLWFVIEMHEVEPAHADAETELRSMVMHVDGDQQAARRAMNDAAGQSWRNPFE